MAGRSRKGAFARYWPRLFLIIPFALVVWVPAYNRIEPTLAGIPFFYWYQLVAILLGAVVIMTVHLLDKRIRRGAAGGSGEEESSGSAGDTR